MFPPAVQLVPPYSSVVFVSADGARPPKPSPAVCVPAPPKLRLVVLKLPPLLQPEPLYSSVTFVFVEGSERPPKASPAV
jgi:hypothetical protein